MASAVSPMPARQTRLCGGRSLTIETFAPAGNDAGATPAVVLLHDAGGADGEAVRADARRLAGGGLRILLPRYLEATGHDRIGFSEIARHREAWGALVAAFLRDIAEEEGGGPLGLVGRSLGGALAISAALEARGIAALVLRSAFVPPELEGRPLPLPPVLSLHGGRDALVPPRHAERLAEGVARAGGACERVPYADQAHAFDAAAEADAGARTLAFLRRHLPGSQDHRTP